MESFNNTTLGGSADFGSPRVPLSSYTEFIAGMVLLKWVLPIIILLGTVGNVLSFMVMMRKGMRSSSTCFYLALLAIVDTMVLYVSAMKTCVRSWTDYELLHASDTLCKTLKFLFLFSSNFSAWLVVAMTMERFIVVWFPFKATTLCNTRRTRIVTICIALVLVAINLHNFWTNHLIEVGENRWKCKSTMNNSYFAQHVFPWINFAIYSAIPFGVVLVCNVMIIVRLMQHRHAIAHRAIQEDYREASMANHYKLTIMLLCISFIWIFTTAPITIFTFIKHRNTNDHEHAKYILIRIVCYLLMYVNHAINFYIYCITGQKFRRELMRMFYHKRRSSTMTKLTKFNTKSSTKQSSKRKADRTNSPLMENLLIEVVNK